MDKISDEDIAKLYASLMAEVKVRLQKLELEINLSRVPKGPTELTFQAEFCYLQLRRITELTALAVLLAHNPYDEFRAKLPDAWNADYLLKQLTKLNATAFPQPINMPKGSKDGDHVTFVMRPPTFESRDAICAIYTEACDKLHAGALRSVLKRRNKHYSFPHILQSFQRLRATLDSHVIVLPDRRAMHAWLNYGSDEQVFCQWLDPPGLQP